MIEYTIYKGYIIGLSIQEPSYDVREALVFTTRDQITSGYPMHTSGSEGEAMFWIDESIESSGYGTATQADVDEYNEQADMVILPLSELLTPDFLESLRFSIGAAWSDGAIDEKVMKGDQKRLDKVARSLGYTVDETSFFRRYKR